MLIVDFSVQSQIINHESTIPTVSGSRKTPSQSGFLQHIRPFGNILLTNPYRKYSSHAPDPDGFLSQFKFPFAVPEKFRPFGTREDDQLRNRHIPNAVYSGTGDSELHLAVTREEGLDDGTQPLPGKGVVAVDGLVAHVAVDATKAAQAAASDASPIDDHRGSAWYRTQMVEKLTQRLLKVCVERARGNK